MIGDFNYGWSKNKKNDKYPCKLQFLFNNCIKVGFKEVFIKQTCYPDDHAATCKVFVVVAFFLQIYIECDTIPESFYLIII